jgi:membrane protein
LIPSRFQLLTDRVNEGAGHLRPLRSTATYLARTEVHVFGFSIAASVLLSLYPFLNVMASLAKHVFKWPAALTAIQNAITDYFPGELGKILASYFLYPRKIELVSILLLLFTANGIFEPLEVALNRAWGITRDRSYVKNQLLSFVLILLCGGLALASFLFTAMNQELLIKLFGSDEPLPRWITIVLFRLIAVPMTMLALFLTYWLLPNCRVPVKKIAPVAFVVGLALTVLQYAAVLLWQWIIAKMKHDYGPFAHSASIILFSFLAAMIVLAGAEWSARPTGQPQPDRIVPVPQIPVPQIPVPQIKGDSQ